MYILLDCGYVGRKRKFEFLLNYENYNNVFDKLQKFVSEFISTILSNNNTSSAISDKL